MDQSNSLIQQEYADVILTEPLQQAWDLKDVKNKIHAGAICFQIQTQDQIRHGVFVLQTYHIGMEISVFLYVLQEKSQHHTAHLTYKLVHQFHAAQDKVSVQVLLHIYIKDRVC